MTPAARLKKRNSGRSHRVVPPFSKTRTIPARELNKQVPAKNKPMVRLVICAVTPGSWRALEPSHGVQGTRSWYPHEYTCCLSVLDCIPLRDFCVQLFHRIRKLPQIV